MGIAWWVLKTIITYFLLRDVALYVLPFIVSKVIAFALWLLSASLALVMPKTLAEKTEEDIKAAVGEGLDDIGDEVEDVTDAVMQAAAAAVAKDK